MTPRVRRPRDLDLDLTLEESERLEQARRLVSYPDFHLRTGEFCKVAIMAAVDEVLGTNDAVWRERIGHERSARPLQGSATPGQGGQDDQAEAGAGQAPGKMSQELSEKVAKGWQR